MRPEVLNEREKTHGKFKNHAIVTQAMKAILHHPYVVNKPNSLCSEHREALEMIVHKIGRILAGNPLEKDHWVDIAGYAHLGAEACDEPR